MAQKKPRRWPHQWLCENAERRAHSVGGRDWRDKRSSETVRVSGPWSVVRCSRGIGHRAWRLEG
jgi:hypothetical protein